MVLRLIDAYDCNPGTTIFYEGQACTIRSKDTSKTGKHGASKCRLEAIEILTGKKRIITVPGSERFEVPMIDKRKAQILNVSDTTASVMDLESFETLDLPFMDEVKNDLAPEKQVEYWDIEGRKVIMRMSN